MPFMARLPLTKTVHREQDHALLPKPSVACLVTTSARPPPRSPRKSATCRSGRADEGTAPDCLSHTRRSRDRLSESLDAAASASAALRPAHPSPSQSSRAFRVEAQLADHFRLGLHPIDFNAQHLFGTPSFLFYPQTSRIGRLSAR